MACQAKKRMKDRLQKSVQLSPNSEYRKREREADRIRTVERRGRDPEVKEKECLVFSVQCLDFIFCTSSGLTESILLPNSIHGLHLTVTSRIFSTRTINGYTLHLEYSLQLVDQTRASDHVNIGELRSSGRYPKISGPCLYALLSRAVGAQRETQLSVVPEAAL